MPCARHAPQPSPESDQNTSTHPNQPRPKEHPGSSNTQSRYRTKQRSDPQQTRRPDDHPGSPPSPFRGFPAKHAVRPAPSAADPRNGPRHPHAAKPSRCQGTPPAASYIHHKRTRRSQPGHQTAVPWGRHPEAGAAATDALSGPTSGSGRLREHRIRSAGASATEPAEDAGPKGRPDERTEHAEDVRPIGQQRATKRGSQPLGTAGAPSPAHQRGAATRKGPHRRRRSTLRR